MLIYFEIKINAKWLSARATVKVNYDRLLARNVSIYDNNKQFENYNAELKFAKDFNKRVNNIASKNSPQDFIFHSNLQDETLKNTLKCNLRNLN